MTLGAACIALCACADGEAWSGPLPAVDVVAFEADVYPVLLRDCAFSECHGAEHRFFQVYGPGRTRLDPTTMIADPATPAEVQRSYERALSMLVSDADPKRSLLLTKPLEISAGGQGHQGTDELGHNVYASKLDPAYAAIERWCIETVARAGAQP